MSVPEPPQNRNPDRPLAPEETVALLVRVRGGEAAALELLLARLLPRLRRWAHGRLPRSSRGMLETADIVQNVASKTIRQLAHLDVSQVGALGFYLRQAISNEIASQWRRADRVPFETSLDDSRSSGETSALDKLIGAERMRRYEAALLCLKPPDRDAIVGRFEFDYNYEELAIYLGKPTAAAARVAVHRAVKRLAEAARQL